MVYLNWKSYLVSDINASIEAAQLEEPFLLITAQGTFHGKAGDYIYKQQDSLLLFASKEDFDDWSKRGLLERMP